MTLRVKRDGGGEEGGFAQMFVQMDGARVLVDSMAQLNRKTQYVLSALPTHSPQPSLHPHGSHTHVRFVMLIYPQENSR